MARISRDEYAKASGVFGLAPGGVQKQEDSAWSSDGRGSCKVLKEGSDITTDPPVFVLEGKDGYMLRILTDASLCTHYERNEFIDKDGYECSDPAFRRFIRQLRDK